MIKKHIQPITLLATLSLLLACNPNPSAITPGAQTASPQSSAQPSTTPTTSTSGLTLDLTQGRGNIGGQLLDAKTQALLKKVVNITITGPDKDKIEKTSLETQTGLFSLVLKKGVTPAINQPVKVSVVAQAEGYFSASTNLSLTDSKHDSFVLKMVNQTDAPPGIALASASAEATSGKLNQSLQLSAIESDSKSLASFALKPQTLITDANGNPLSGPLQTHLGYFSNTTTGSLDAFPGGFAPVVSQNGQDSNGYFITGGFVSVEISDQSGRKASQFSQPADITIQIPQGTRNPDTGKVVNNGDTIGIWSHDPNTGKWTSEGVGDVSGPDNNGNFNVTYQASHLSYWNIDWHSSAVCDPKVMLKWDSANQIGVQVSLLFEGQDWYTPTNILSDPENQLYNVPINKALNFVAKYNGKEVGSKQVTLTESCADVDLDIQTTGLPSMRRLPVELSLSGQSSFTRPEISNLADQFGLNEELKTRVLNYTHPGDPTALFQFTEKRLADLEALGATRIRDVKSMVETKIRPTTYLYYKNSDPNDWQYEWVLFEDGKANLSLLDGQSYDFSGTIFYNDKWFQIDQTVKVTPELKSLNLDMRNAQLTVDVVQTYLQGLLNTMPPKLN